MRTPEEHYIYIWEFEIAPGRLEQFLRSYGPDGDWALLFRRSRGYLGTSLLRDEDNPNRYVTVDRWISRADHDSFRSQFGAEYEALDRACEKLTIREARIGNFLRTSGNADAD